MDYPPSTGRKNEIDRAISKIEIAAAGQTTTYLSTPITTGRRLYDYIKDQGLNTPEQLRQEERLSLVVRPNIRRAREVRDLIERSLGGYVIDPTEIEFDAWTQSDYRVLWAEVIARIALRVVFVDGWQYSSGCAYECLSAARNHRQLLSEQLRPITLERAVELLREATTDIRAQCGDATFHEHVLKDLRTTGLLSAGW